MTTSHREPAAVTLILAPLYQWCNSRMSNLRLIKKSWVWLPVKSLSVTVGRQVNHPAI